MLPDGFGLERGHVGHETGGGGVLLINGVVALMRVGDSDDVTVLLQVRTALKHHTCLLGANVMSFFCWIRETKFGV